MITSFSDSRMSTIVRYGKGTLDRLLAVDVVRGADFLASTAGQLLLFGPLG